MSEGFNKGFVCIWKIVHFNNSSKFYSFGGIHSAEFTTESIGRGEWELFLCCYKNQVACKLISKSNPINTDISFRYELTSPEGVILMASEQLSHVFSQYWQHEVFLIKGDELRKEMSSWSEDTLTLRLYMDCADDVTLPVSTCQIKTDIDETLSFLMPFNSSNEPVKKRLSLCDIPVEISFQCINSSLAVNFLYDVKDREDFWAWCELSLVDTKGSTLKKEVFPLRSNRGDRGINVTTEIMEMRDEIRIKFEIEYSYKSIVTYDKLHLERDKNSEKKKEKEANSKIDDECLFYLQKHLRSMFSDEKFTDVKLRVDNEVFCAHKSLLAARSPVFSAMFDKDMSESNTGIVDIIDVEANSLKSFLEYIYTGTVEAMSFDVALNLLVMSHKYEVSPLTRKSSNFLKSALSHSNACEVLSIADMIHHEELKSAAMDYILVNSTAILTSPQWAEWLKSNTILASEVFHKMSIKFDGGTMKHLWEENPEEFGIRRSGRSRKEPERYTIGDEFEESDSGQKKDTKSGKRVKRKQSQDWKESGSDSDSDDSAYQSKRSAPRNKSSHSEKKRPIKSSSSKKKGKSEKKEHDSSDEDYYDSDGSDKQVPLRQSRKSVSYEEQSADETDSDDLVEMEYNETIMEEETAECIEKVLDQRIGKKGGLS